MISVTIDMFTAVSRGMAAERLVLPDGRQMAPLLPRSAEELKGFWDQGLSALAFDADGQVIGHAAVEPLIGRWFELGAVWVHPQARNGQSGGRHVGLRMYRALLPAHGEKNILATTINPAAFVVGARVGMVPIPYASLPQEVWRATCVCPPEKTGAVRDRNVPGCTLRDRICFVRVTDETWHRLGQPERIKLPIVPSHEAPVIPDDGLRIVLSV